MMKIFFKKYITNEEVGGSRVRRYEDSVSHGSQLLYPIWRGEESLHAA